MIFTRLGFGGLDEAVQAFENTVGDLAFEPAEPAVPMVHAGVGEGDFDDRQQAAGLGVFSIQAFNKVVPWWRFLTVKMS